MEDWLGSRWLQLGVGLILAAWLWSRYASWAKTKGGRLAKVYCNHCNWEGTVPRSALRCGKCGSTNLTHTTH